MSTVCRFYLQGNCKYGSSCRNIHPQGRGGRGGRGQSNSYRGGGGQSYRGSSSRHQPNPYEDIGRGWDKKSGNRFEAFNDHNRGGPSYGIFGDSRQQGRGGRGGGGDHWRGGGGNWRGGGGNWRGGGSSSGGGHWRGDSGGNWRGGGGTRNWRGGGGNWRGGSSDRGSNFFQQDRQRSDNFHQSSRGWWQGNDHRQDKGRQDSNFFRQSNWQSSDQQSRGAWWQQGGGQGRGGGGWRGSRARDDWSSERGGSSHYSGGDGQQLPTASEIVTLVKEDMKEWSQSSMWLLSCYTPHRLLTCIPGFEDYSQEEVRWAAYQASATGAGAATHQQALTQLYAQYKDTWQKCSSITIQDAAKLTQVSSSSLFSTSQPEKDSLFSAPKESLFGDLVPSSPQLMADKPPASQQLFSLPGAPSSPPPASQPGRVLFQTPSNSLFNPVSTPQTLQQQQQPEAAGEAVLDSPGLSEEDLAAFRADKFTLGAIPEHAPPTTLCH